MGHSTSKLQQHHLTHSSSFPHPLISTPAYHPHQQPATYSHAPPSPAFVNDGPLSPPPGSAKSFSAMGYGPAPTHSSIWFPAPENGLTSEARRYRDEVLAESRREEEKERLSKRGWLGGIDGKGARAPQAQTVEKKMSVGKWKDGMVGSVMERGRSWRGSLTRGDSAGGGDGSKRSKRGCKEVDEAAERRSRSVTDHDLLAAVTRAEDLEQIPAGLRPGNGDDASTPTSHLRRPHSEVLASSSSPSMDQAHRLSSPSCSRILPRPHPHLSFLPPAFVHHPSSLLPGLPTPRHVAAPFTATVNLNSPCSETLDSPFLPPLSPALEQQEIVEDEDPNDRSALSPTRLAMLLHPLSLRPGGSSPSSRNSSVAPASSRDTSSGGGREVGATGGWFAGRQVEVDNEALGLSLSVSEQARLSLPPPPSPLPDGILGGVAARRVEPPLYSPLTEDGPPSPDDLNPSPSPPTQTPSPVIPPPPHPTPVVHQGLALPGAEVEVAGPPVIAESSFTGTNFPPPRASASTSPYHLPPNISISIQCDALIRELTSPERIPLPSSPLITPSTSLATALAASQIYAAPHLPSPILPNSNCTPSPIYPLARRSVLEPTDEHPEEGGEAGDVSFQTPPLVQRVSSTNVRMLARGETTGGFGFGFGFRFALVVFLVLS